MDMKNVSGTYMTFAQQRQKLANLLGEASSVVSALNMEQLHDSLKKLQDKAQNDAFKIMVVGTFKNGKSTFINSFLGKDILPAYSIPTTAVINEVKYGETKRAVLHFRDPLPAQLPHSLPPRALTHLQQYKGAAVPPLEVPYDELEDYVVIPMGEDAREMLLESPYEKLELFWPLELLKNGVVIIDSPGLNEHATRTRVTMEYLNNADAILMVLNSTALCSQTEMQFIENDLKDQGFEEPFFVANMFDRIPPRERSAVQQFAQAKLKDYTNFGTEGIYFVSALDALDGKMEHDAEKYERSGMGPFENRLSIFLTTSKGRAKLAQPAKELRRVLSVDVLEKSIPMQRQMLQHSLTDVKARYEKTKPELQKLIRRKDQLHSQMQMKVEQSRYSFHRIISRNMQDLIDVVPVWISEYTLQTKLGLIPNKQKVAAAVQELSDYLSQKCTQQQAEWRNTVLSALIQEKSAAIFESAEKDAKDILNEVDQIQLKLSNGEINPNPVPTWQRIVGAAGGILIGDLGLAASGGINGLSMELAKTFAFEAGGGVVLAVLGLLNPITLIAILAASFMMNWTKGASNVEKKLKAAVTEQIVTSLTQNAESSVDSMTDGIIQKFNQIVDGITSSLDGEIQQVNTQIEHIIAEMEKGQANVDKHQKMLDQCEQKARSLNNELDDLIFQLMKG